MDGFLNILKPPGMTSHNVVEYIRKIYPGVKAGHGGTLDPGAAGVLPVLLGKATRLSSFLLDISKVYRAEIYLGVSTDTADSFGNIIAQKDPPSYKVEELLGVISTFNGELEQLPPMYAAVKKDGKKLYQYARKGITVERNPRKIRIYSINLIDYNPPERVLLEIECSKGTYIRTLCSQIGDALGCLGHMSFLLRKQVGGFLLSEACTLEDVEHFGANNNIEKLLLPLDFPFRNMDFLVLSDENIRHLVQGRSVSLEKIAGDAVNICKAPVDDKLLPVYTTKREFTALARWKENKKDNFILKPEKVFKL